jgi:hypothetical protein
LALALGMVEALPSRAAAVIDSALAACADVATETVHVDLHMHEAVLTVCRPGAERVRIAEQAVFPGFGMSHIQNSLARHIGDLLIETYRFDPLHTSTTEQAIYDQISHWLTRLCWEDEVSVRLASEHGEHPYILTRSAVSSLIGERFANASKFLGKWKDRPLRLSHTCSPLAGLVAEFSGAELLNQTAGTEQSLSRKETFAGQEGALRRLCELPRTEPAPAQPEKNGALATHLLCGDQALPLSQPVSILIEGGGPQITGGIDPQAAVTVVLRNGVLDTLQGGADVSLPPTGGPGESIRVGNHELRLIRVRAE